MANVPIVPEALKQVSQQPRVRDYLSSALVEGRVSHAYLFVGAPGAGMLEVADAFAQCLVCPEGGCGTCGECIRVAHHTHPDVRHLEPAGVSGYLIDQIRELVEDVVRTPVRSNVKVYIIDSADRLRGRSANALLKTIEEPPDFAVFILIARTVDAVLPTIVSRCQQVPFRVVSTATAVEAVCRKTGASAEEATIALSIGITTEKAAEFLASPSRRAVRRCAVRIVGELANDDVWDVVNAAQELVDAVQVSAGLISSGKKLKRETVIKQAVESRTVGQEDYYTPAMLKQLEETVQRELTARERSGIIEALAAIESVLRDVLIRCEGVTEPVVNSDASELIERIARSTSCTGVLAALDTCRVAADDIAHNVTPQLAVEAMLFGVKEALACQ